MKMREVERSKNQIELIYVTHLFYKEIFHNNFICLWYRNMNTKIKNKLRKEL